MRGLSVRRINAPVHSGVFPRVRGLSVTFFSRRHEHKVFPCAGVIGSSRMHYLCMTRIPPCAGVIEQRFRIIWLERVFPRVRGLSVVLSTVTRWLEVFPRMRGYRLREAKTPPRQGYSPRVRGLSVTFFSRRHEHKVFPPCAGVIGSSRMHYLCMTRIPPVCGGYRPRLSKAK